MMLTENEVREISGRLTLENTGTPDDELSGDIDAIVCRVDVFPLDDKESILHRHIDIEYSFGDYYEVQEDDPLFQFIVQLSGLSLPEEETEIVLYQG